MRDHRDDGFVKIQFLWDDEDGPQNESTWARPTPEGFVVENIPFFVRGYAYLDVVAAVRDADGVRVVTELLRASGHGCIRVIAADVADIAALRAEIRALGCGSELCSGKFFAVDVVPAAWPALHAFLSAAEEGGRLEYEEGCLPARVD